MREGLRTMKLLLDTNVVIDYVGRRDPFFKDAASLVIMQLFGDAQLFMPAQGVTDVSHILKRCSQDTSDELQRAICNFCETVQPISLSAADIQRACELGWNDMEDCLVSVAATKIGADYLVTRNISDFTRSNVPVVTPAQMMQRIADKRKTAYEQLTEFC